MTNYVEKITRSARLNFGRIDDVMETPYLLEMQLRSYRDFLQYDVPPKKRKAVGLEGVFQLVFPIQASNSDVTMEYLGYHFLPPMFDIEECKIRDKTYAAPLYIGVRIVIKDENNKVKEIREDKKFYIGDIPLMTGNGSFVINGTERVIVSQLHRSPGVIFEQSSNKGFAVDKTLYSARIIPYRGSWLDFEFDSKDLLYMRIDRRRKLPATVLLSALGCSPEEILSLFFKINTYTIDATNKSLYTTTFYPDRLRGELLEFDIKKNNKVLVATGQRLNSESIQKLIDAKVKEITVPESHLYGRILAKDIVDTDTGEVLYVANTALTDVILKDLDSKKIRVIDTLHINELDCGPFISKTLKEQLANCTNAHIEIFRIMRPGSPASEDVVQTVFDNLFFSKEYYDLSSVGRMKLNHHLSLDTDPDQHLLTKEDIIAVMRQLIAIRNGLGEVYDIDHLGNRRVRSVGELTENQFRIGLVRIERIVSDRLNTVEQDKTIDPADILNTKLIQGVLQEFFGSSQLSQFMDQINPLAEVTHKRRVSALGPGGLTRERAGFEVRDVHPTHYGRVCPVETPEGPNIGLINSLAIYARTDKYGFIETPYRRIEKGRVTGVIDYVSAIDEAKYVIAQASAKLDARGTFTEEVVAVRYNEESVLSAPENIDYMDVSPRQAMSVAAALVPFLEHDDANRALMGANMQRQAVPVIKLQSPLVGTGLENVVARDAGACILAKRGGTVESVHAGTVVVRVNDREIKPGDSVVDIYNLIKYSRSNQNTCINQRPLVKTGEQIEAGMIIGDGHSVDKGELALGQNIRIAFMPWNGYNYEDSILISDRIVREERFTSIHIQELTCTALDTKLGPEEVTADVANVSEARRSKLDDSGIVYVGAEVGPGDVLVGKVTPKGESVLTPEDKLLRAIFGEKAADVKNTSLCVPPGTYGTVIDVQMSVRNRQDKEKDVRAMEIEKSKIEKIQEDSKEELRIVEDVSYSHLRQLILGEVPVADKLGSVKGKAKLTTDILDNVKSKDWLSYRFNDAKLNDAIEILKKQLIKHRSSLMEKMKAKEEKMKNDDMTNSGILKKVKIFLAVKRFIQPGDKLAGRHGSKGVISIVVPMEDMPYDKNGEPVDMVLNPLGVPSRMNVGQIFEAHLGLAAKELGSKVDRMVKENKAQAQIKDFLKEIYKIGDVQASKALDKMPSKELGGLIQRVRSGVPMATPVFDGCSEEQIKALLTLADISTTGQMKLYDGRSGDAYLRPVTVGNMYMMKLNHLVDEKMHARSTGPYSLVTQQPLGGKSHEGGQRFGEMEVWALEAYGAANILQEMLTVKSDNMMGRNRMYKRILDCDYVLEGDLPDSFQVLMREIRALGINLEIEHDHNMLLSILDEKKDTKMLSKY